MKKRVLKIIATFLLLFVLIMVETYKVLAVGDPAEMLVPHNIDGAESLEEIGEDILGIVTVVGYAMAVIISIIVGIKYMTGSVEEKAGYKKSMMPYIIGCVVLVAAPTITNIVYDLSKPLRASAVIKTEFCLCGTLKGEKCYHQETGNGPGFRDGYYCTGCERESGKKCSICGAEYAGN